MLNQFRSNMAAHFVRLFKVAENAEGKLAEMKDLVESIKAVKIELKIKELSNENNILTSKVKAAKAELIRLEIQNGKKQYPIPDKTENLTLENVNVATTTAVATEQAPIENPPAIKKQKDPPKKAKDVTKSSTESTIETVDVRKLDFRIGKIVEINKHPDADSLYVEKIDCGEDNPRTVVSGLVNHIPINEMKEKIVMVLCNLKPVKVKNNDMRGVTSEAMVMCASSPDKVEVLIPPISAVPGDLVTCEGYPREPEAVLNPKKKIFETCAPDLKTNDAKEACYKNTPLVVAGKGPITAPTLKGVNVK